MITKAPKTPGYQLSRSTWNNEGIIGVKLVWKPENPPHNSGSSLGMCVNVHADLSPPYTTQETLILQHKRIIQRMEYDGNLHGQEELRGRGHPQSPEPQSNNTLNRASLPLSSEGEHSPCHTYVERLDDKLSY